jgi:hypothetical protein
MASRPKKKSTLKDYTGEVKAELQLVRELSPARDRT